LEFLGDALVGLLVSRFLYEAYPFASEGDLSLMRSRLVSRDALAGIAERLQLGDFVKLGKGEELSRGRKKVSILSGTLEALIAAIYLDGGWSHLCGFLYPLLQDASSRVPLSANLDAKSELQSLVQAQFHTLPQYRVRTRRGPSHHPTYWVEVRAGQKVLGKGRGRRKKDAEQEAARVALLGWQKEDGG
jgi:ribonuclease-3